MATIDTISPPAVGVVLPAGGSGLRFGGKKQFLTLAGQPLISYTLAPFIQLNFIKEIIIAVPLESLTDTQHIAGLDSLGNKVKIISGGSRRQDSVMKGINALNQSIEIVIVHDAVRPFVTKEIITKTVSACQDYDGAIAAIPIKDTIKTVSADVIDGTVARENLWQAQTPQTFHLMQLKQALKHAHDNDIAITDESSIMEILGFKIKIVKGSSSNIKITTRNDWELAEAMINKVENKS